MTEYLFAHGANETAHTGRTLYDHLIGTYLILRSWGDDYVEDHVAVAGMFHSIYGTTYFKHQTTDNRNEIRDLIGSKAEKLVWAFCLLGQPRKDHMLNTARTHWVAIDELYMIDCANTLDVGKQAYDMTGVEHFFSPKAIEQNDELIKLIEDAEQETFSNFSDG